MRNKSEYEHDLEIISDMLKQAKDNGLEVEVVWSFTQACQDASPIYEAAIYALYEWDI